MIWRRRINKSRRLLTENLLLKVTMEEGVRDIHLVYRPGTRDRKLEDGEDRARLEDRSESVSEVDASTLAEAVNNPTHLVANEGTIRTELVLEDPLPGNHISVLGSGNKLPSPIPLQCVKLLLHPSHPELGQRTPVWARVTGPTAEATGGGAGGADAAGAAVFW